MVVSLYICEIPRNINKKDLEDLFMEMDGFIELRLKGTNDMRKIGFVDFKEENQAHFAMETLQGFKFSENDKGIMIKISDNTKGGQIQSKKNDGRKKNHLGYKTKRSDSESDRGRLIKKPNNDTYREISSPRKNLNGTKSYSPSHTSKSDEDSHVLEKNSNNNIKSTSSNNLNTSNNNSNLFDLLALLSGAQSNQGKPISTNKPYLISDNQASNLSSNQNLNDPNILGNFIDCLQNIHTVQLLSSLTSQESPQVETLKNKENNSNHSVPVHHSQHVSSQSNSFSHNIFKFDHYFNSHMEFRKNATNIVYVEGLPNDSTEREISHIFRPFVGFKSVRLITREKEGRKSLICFADFETIVQSTICINTLQGYRFDKNDLVGLHFSYGVNKKKEKRLFS